MGRVTWLGQVLRYMIACAQALPRPEDLAGHELFTLENACADVCDAVQFVRDNLPLLNTPIGHRGVFNKYIMPAKSLRQSLHKQHANCQACCAP